LDFWFEKSTPANTAKKDALKTAMPMKEGVVTHVWVLHPPGCKGLAHAQIWHGLHQLWPTNPEASYHGDTFPMEFNEGRQLKKPVELTLVTWNLDDTYAHSVYMRITIMPEWLAWPYIIVRDLVDVIKKLLGL